MKDKVDYVINIISDRGGSDMKDFDLPNEIIEVVAAQGQGLILTILAEGNEDAEKKVVRGFSATHPTHSQALKGSSSKWLSKYPLYLIIPRHYH